MISNIPSEANCKLYFFTYFCRYEDSPKFRQTFADKMIYKAQDPKSFIGYKKDQRGVLDQAPIKSEKFVDEQNKKFLDLKT